jgi:hypothetical protein
MFDEIKGLGAGGILGVIIGIALVIWVAPTTAGGVGLVILVSAFAVALVVQTVRWISSRTNTSRIDPSKGDHRRTRQRNRVTKT